jgi:ATP-dependent helicase/nuclease subunit B
MRIFVSPDNQRRLEVASDFLSQLPPGREVALVGPTRRAADELVHQLAQKLGGLFGVSPTSLEQLAIALATPQLAAQQRAPASGSVLEAVAARVMVDEPLGRFEPLRDSRRFPRALARTLNELRLAQVDTQDLDEDLAPLMERYLQELETAGLADQRQVLEAAGAGELPTHPILFLDLAVSSPVHARLVNQLVQRAERTLVTIPDGDQKTIDYLQGEPERDEMASQTALERLKFEIFAPTRSGVQNPEQVAFFSAPGEGRECVEIARRIIEEARRGVPLDNIAVVLRSTSYSAYLETALRRAGIPAYFLKGTRRPEPSGRAFATLLRCAQEGLSARRFAEYLSLGQTPVAGPRGEPPEDPQTWLEPTEDRPTSEDAPPMEAQEGHFPVPRWWEQLLVEASVLRGADRWRTRLAGLEVEYGMRAAELEPDSSHRQRCLRTARQLAQLRKFAVPLIEELEAFPQQPAPWDEWLVHLRKMAGRSLRNPDHVLAQLISLSSLGGKLTADLATVINVLEDRLLALRSEPPRRRFGRVFVGTPECLRSRSFEVVFLPGLAEGTFPVKLVEDPLLADPARQQLSPHLRTREDLAREERLRLRLTLGAVRSRLHLSYPRLEASQGRPRVPSFYALEILRTARGQFPKLVDMEAEGIRASRSRLDWPAPPQPEQAIDVFEHDLAVIRNLLSQREHATGRARYLLESNPYLSKSLGRRWLRWNSGWSPADGLLNPKEEVRQALQELRLGQRAYSPTSLQRFARCPYHFYLASIQRLSPREDFESDEEITPQVKGIIVHEVQARFMLESYSYDAHGLNQALDAVAGEYEETLAPAIRRVWSDEIERLRIDLQTWLKHLQEQQTQWQPTAFEWSFGLSRSSHRDPQSRDEPVLIDGRFQLHGCVDWVDTDRHNGHIRVTDHKTGSPLRGKLSAVQGGEVLQPLLYGMAAEIGLGVTARIGRLFYCTTKGGFRERSVMLGSRERRAVLQVLEAVDLSISSGFFPAFPKTGACNYCDFQAVCGPSEEQRTGRKTSHSQLTPLAEIRELE